MNIKTIEWQENAIKIIDQSELPQQLKYIYLKDIKSLWKAIKTMQIRGAPVLGVACSLGAYLGIKDTKAKTWPQFYRELKRACRYLGSCRPTARNLFYALDKALSTAVLNKGKPISKIKKLIFEEAKKTMEEDRIACRKIGYYGSGLVEKKDAILTICNAGTLATIDYGTALGVIYYAKKQGKKIRVYACETRPMLQGARLTTWELKKKGVDVTLICDSMAAALMQQGKINKVIAGADRIAANGDTANKIGTYNLAVLSHYHKIPFYIAAPASTFDLGIKNGREIPIEERPAREITDLFFKQPTAAKNIKVFNPAFDVTPNGLITAIITEEGIIRPPYKRNIAKIFRINVSK